MVAILVTSACASVPQRPPDAAISTQRWAGSGYTTAVGGRLARVDGQGIDTVLALLTPLVSHENEWGLRTELPGLLRLPELLHAVGIARDSTSVTFGLVMPDGRDLDVAVALEDPRPSAAEPIDLPLYRRNPSLNYWMAYLHATRSSTLPTTSVTTAKTCPSTASPTRFSTRSASGVRSAWSSI